LATSRKKQGKGRVYQNPSSDFTYEIPNEAMKLPFIYGTPTSIADPVKSKDGFKEPEITQPPTDILSSRFTSRDHEIALDGTNSTGDPSNTSGLYINPTDSKKSATASEDYVIEPPTAYKRLFVVQNLPLAWRITFGVAQDCWKSGDSFPFEFAVHKQAEVQKEDWSDEALTVFRNIGFMRSGPQHMGIGEMDGEALLFLMEQGFDWETTELDKPRDTSLPIVDTFTLPMYYVYHSSNTGYTEWKADGEPKYWHVNLTAIDARSRPTTRSVKVHYSRVIHYTPEPLDSSTKGLCTLDRCWQAICIGFNIDLGTGEAFFRWGPGHPVITTPFNDVAQLKQFMDEIGSPNRRTWHALLDGMDLKFAGVASSSMNFSGGKETSVYDEVSIGTGIPRPIIKGEVAGVQTGSEVNERTYWGILRTKQFAYNEVIWKLLAVLCETGQVEDVEISYNMETGLLITPYNTNVKWAVHYVETEEQKVDILTKKLQTLTPIKDILTINELRAYTEDILNMPEGTYPPFPPEIGDRLLSMPNINEGGEEDLPDDLDPDDTEKGKPQTCAAIKKNGLPCERKPLPGSSYCKNHQGWAQGKQGGGGLRVKGVVSSTRKQARVKPHRRKAVGPRSAGHLRGSHRRSGIGGGSYDSLEEDDITFDKDSPIIGCPDHPQFKQNCPACAQMLHYKEDMARHLLGMGYSISQVQKYLALNRNKVHEIRQALLNDRNDLQ